MHQGLTTTPTQTDLAKQVLSLVRGVYSQLHRLQPEPRVISPPSTLERDLGFDSLARVELLLRLERDLGVDLPESTLASAETVADLITAVTAARSRPSVRAPWVHAAPLPLAAERLSGTPVAATTLNETLSWHVAQHPDATHAMVLEETGVRPLSYAALQAGAQRIAGGLLAVGVTTGATVALMLPTGTEYLYAFLGVLQAGAVPVPIYPPTRPSQLEEHVSRHAGILANAAATALITVPEARTVARLLRTRVPGLRHILSASELLSCDVPAVLPSPAPSSLAMLQYTSGSTGSPKGVMLTHADLLANIRIMGDAMHATPADVLVSWLPLYHDMGLIGAWLGSLYFGCLFVVMPPTAFLARPQRWLRAIHDYRGTISASPNFGYELCARRLSDEDLAGVDLSCWRLAVNGAEPVSPDTIERFCRRFERCGFRRQAMTPVFGLAEAAVGLAFPPPDRGPVVDWVDRAQMMSVGRAAMVPAGTVGALRFVSCGRPLPGYRIRIVDEQDVEVPERIEGGLQFTGPSATAGYHRNEPATTSLLHGEWRDSGDRAYIANGEVYITGRVKDIVIRRGRHIYPEEIESAVGDVPGIRKGCVVVFGTREPLTATEKLIVLAETHEDDAAERARLTARINERVVDCIGEPPDEILIVPPRTVLKTSSGKLRRAATRAAYENDSLMRAPASARQQMLRLISEGALLAVRRRVRSGIRVAYGLYAWFAFAVLAVPLSAFMVLPWSRESAWHAVHVAARRLIGAWRMPVTLHDETGGRLPAAHVIVANHCSYLDTLVIGSVLRQPHVFVAKAQLQWVPLLGRCMRRTGTLFIERFEPVQSASEVDRMKRELIGGRSLVVFAEGTFTSVTGLRAFHLGAFQAAAAGNMPVIPLALRGTRTALRDGQWLPRRGSIDVAIGPPLTPPGDKDVFAAAVELRDAARDYILRHCGEPDLG